MKHKGTAATIVVLLPLILLSVGVFVASTHRRSIQPHRPATAESAVVSPDPLAIVPELPKVPRASLEPAQLRTELVRLLARIEELFQERGRLLLAANTEPDEDSRNELKLQAKRLQEQLAKLYGELRELCTQDVALTFELVRGQRENTTQSLMLDAVRPNLESETAGVDSPSGPMLRLLLSFARGGNDEKRLFLQTMYGFGRPNRDVGQALLELAVDGDFMVRGSAELAIQQQALRGDLRDFFREHADLLLALAERDRGGPGDGSRRGILNALSVLGLPQADELILQRFENSRNSPGAHFEAQAMLNVASRTLGQNDQRLADAILTALDSPNRSHVYWPLVDLALYLPAPRCIEMLRAIAAAPPQNEPTAPQSVQAVIAKVEAGEIERLRAAKDRHRNRQYTGAGRTPGVRTGQPQ